VKEIEYASGRSVAVASGGASADAAWMSTTTSRRCNRTEDARDGAAAGKDEQQQQKNNADRPRRSLWTSDHRKKSIVSPALSGVFCSFLSTDANLQA